MLDGIAAVFLDLDGTLCYYGISYEEASHRALVERGLGDLRLPPEETYYAIYDEVLQGTSDRGHDAVTVEAFARMLADLGVADRGEARAVAETYRRLRSESLALYDEVDEALALLGERFALGLISNGPSEVQWNKVRALGLADRLDAVVISGDVGVHKPDPAIFRLALGKVGAAPGEALHAGDSLRDDVAGANAAGLASVWVNRARRSPGPGDPAPAAEVFDLRDLVALLGLTRR